MPSNNTDAVALLEDEHRQGEDPFRRLAAPCHDSRKRTLAEQISMELMIHGLFGDEVFHPSRPDTVPAPDASSVERTGSRVLPSRLAGKAAPAIATFAMHGPAQGALID